MTFRTNAVGLSPTFWAKRPLIGMVHLGTLPGSGRYDANTLPLFAVMTRAAEDAAALREGGAGAIMVENFFDAQFAKTDLSPAHDRCAARAVPGMPLLVGSGFSPDSASALLATGATGVIAGTSLKAAGQIDTTVDAARVRSWRAAMDAA